MRQATDEPRALTLLEKWRDAVDRGHLEKARKYLIELRALAQRPIEREHLTEAERRQQDVASEGKVKTRKSKRTGSYREAAQEHWGRSG